MITVTVTVEQSDYTGETVMTKSAEYGAGNPIYYANEVRTLGLALALEIAERLETLHPATTAGAREAVAEACNADIRKLVAHLRGEATR